MWQCCYVLPHFVFYIAILLLKYMQCGKWRENVREFLHSTKKTITFALYFILFMYMDVVEYRDIHDFKQEDLQRLFLSVDWSSGHYPEKLVVAMKNYETVYSAWDGERLVGMICAMDDGIMTAYVHYLLVDPEYQGRHIGQKLVELVKEKYKDYLRIVLNAYNTKLGFYRSLGFKDGADETPMFITELWT